MNRRTFIHQTLVAASATLLVGKAAGASSVGTKTGRTNARAAVTSVPTDGHTVYHLKPAAVGAGAAARAIYCAAYDGTVLCVTQQGALLWKTRPSAGFP